jgi:hypothetical protein
MPELKGQMDLLDAIQDELGGEPSPARALKILDEARELGWTENPFSSFVVRLTREDAKPFYARWDLSVSASGKKSWRFHGARAANGQPLAFADIKTYLNDPRVIEPEMPDDLCEAAGVEDPEQTEAGALEALRPVLPQASAPIPAADWGALLS